MEFWHKEGLVLDFGCGRGRHCAILSQCGFKVVGIDLETFGYWLKIPDVQFIQGDERKLEAFHDETFDLAISFQVLYVIKDDVTLLNELLRVVKRGGYLVLQVTNQDNLRTVITHKYLVSDPQILRYYTIEGITLLLSNVGFKVVKIWTEKFYPPYLLGAIGFLLEFIFPHCVQEWTSNRTPPRNRGLINVIAQKVMK
jgi:SAM-dependent methyltransferase